MSAKNSGYWLGQKEQGGVTHIINPEDGNNAFCGLKGPFLQVNNQQSNQTCKKCRARMVYNALPGISFQQAQNRLTTVTGDLS